MNKLPNKFTFNHRMDRGTVYTAEVKVTELHKHLFTGEGETLGVEVSWGLCEGPVGYCVSVAEELIADGIWFDIVEVDDE